MSPRVARAPVQVANDAEQRRLSDAVRELSADRDRLQARLASLERNLDDVTGSIPPAAANPKPPETAAAGYRRSSAGSADRSGDRRSSPASTPAVPARITAGHIATGSPAAAESTATRTEFGIDIGANASIEGLRATWTALKVTQPALFDGLRPVIAVREGKTPGSIELHLIAGPLPNASIAARLCATLAAANQNCQPTVFDGQRLALQ